MRRPPSYSDSFLFLSPRHKVNYEEELIGTDVVPCKEEVPVPESWSQSILFFIFKGSFHILCISAFETTFYFLYVNRSEDAGIFTTINTYYQPLVQGCSTRWGNGTKWLVHELFINAINKTTVDAEGLAAYNARTAYNATLVFQSSLYSLACFAVCVGIAIISRVNQWKVNWTPMFVEHLLFIAVLAAYEFFFYTTIIYNYSTLSTAELNKYIIDGLASCAMAPK